MPKKRPRRPSGPRPATERQVQWVLALVRRAERVPTPEFEAALRRLTTVSIREVTARAQSQADKRTNELDREFEQDRPLVFDSSIVA